MFSNITQSVVAFIAPYSTVLIFSAAFLVLAALYWYGIGRFKQLQKLGLKGPKPSLFLGNTLDLFRHNFQMHLFLSELYKKYGRIFGVYINGTPNVVVGDPEMLKQILVKDFARFHDREFASDLPKPQDSFMTMVKGERWKFIRNTLTPSFSTGKMKPMVNIFNNVTDTLIGKLRAAADKGNLIDFVELQQGVTMEAILSAAFGVEAKSQTDPDCRITKLAKNVFHTPWWFLLLIMIPGGNKLIKYISILFGNNFDPLLRMAESIAAKRRRGEGTRQDLLQLMIEAQATADSQGRKLTDDELIAQSALFLVAGFDTSSTTLSLACYYLALYQDVQQKLYDETIKHFGKDDIPTYNSLAEMTYLDQVISETLRLCPAGNILFRTCNEDCEIKGVPFRSGWNIIVPLYCMHRDPEFWEEPEKFDPDRFSPETKASRDPYTYLPFGSGPRNCIGMRFAQMEIKIVLARLIKEFKLEVVPETQELNLVSQVTLGVKHPIKLRILRRK